MTTPLRYAIDMDAERLERIAAEARRRVTVSDLLAEADDLIAQIVDPEDHPAYALAQATLHGGVVAHRVVQQAYQALLDVALDRLVDERMAQDFDGEDA